MMSKKNTQLNRILSHLLEHETITPLEALSEYGCYRLGARIADLRKQGYDIETEITSGKNRYGDRTNFATYRLVVK